MIFEVFGAGLIGIMMCEPGVPGSIIQGRPSPLIAASRWLTAETPTDSGVLLGVDHTHSFWMRSRLVVAAVRHHALGGAGGSVPALTAAATPWLTCSSVFFSARSFASRSRRGASALL